VAGTLRHAELARPVEGVTQRMLTRTLRHLERDGLLVRRDYAEVPPRVDYTLTPLGGDYSYE
jgi:DNA-binding HxlR family transcriptional regulator